MDHYKVSDADSFDYNESSFMPDFDLDDNNVSYLNEESCCQISNPSFQDTADDELLAEAAPLCGNSDEKVRDLSTPILELTLETAEKPSSCHTHTLVEAPVETPIVYDFSAFEPCTDPEVLDWSLAAPPEQDGRQFDKVDDIGDNSIIKKRRFTSIKFPEPQESSPQVLETKSFRRRFNRRKQFKYNKRNNRFQNNFNVIPLTNFNNFDCSTTSNFTTPPNENIQFLPEFSTPPPGFPANPTNFVPQSNTFQTPPPCWNGFQQNMECNGQWDNPNIQPRPFAKQPANRVLYPRLSIQLRRSLYRNSVAHMREHGDKIMKLWTKKPRRIVPSLTPNKSIVFSKVIEGFLENQKQLLEANKLKEEEVADMETVSKALLPIMIALNTNFVNTPLLGQRLLRYIAQNSL